MTEFEREIIEWKATDDTGISSEAIASVMLGLPPKIVNKKFHGYNYPHDADDFGRCYRLLEAVPGIKDRLGLMKSLNGVWAKLVNHWDTLTRLYETRQFRQLYELLQKLEQ